jgi:hypothetical protein
VSKVSKSTDKLAARGRDFTRLSYEQRARKYPQHLGLIVEGSKGGPFWLFEKKGIGVYHSAAALDRAIERWGNRQLRKPRR